MGKLGEQIILDSLKGRYHPNINQILTLLQWKREGKVSITVILFYVCVFIPFVCLFVCFKLEILIFIMN